MSTYTITFCDKCNQAGDFSFDNMKYGVMEDEAVVQVFTYFGDEQKALDNRWELRDYGIVCPFCAMQERQDEANDEEVGAASGCGNEILLGISEVLNAGKDETLFRPKKKVDKK